MSEPETTDNITPFPAPPEQPDLLVGPFEEWRVQVDGRIIPRLTGWREGEKTWLVVDSRFGGVFSTDEDARQAARLIAEAMAVASGYSHSGAQHQGRPFAPIGMGIRDQTNAS